MALKNLLLIVDDTRACARRMDAALAMARDHAAHLTALYCIGEPWMPGPPTVPGQWVEERRRVDSERADEVLKQFHDKAERSGVRYDTRTVRTGAGAVADTIALHARYADLAILGQIDPDDVPAAGRHLVEHVVLGCGRPVLVIPYIGAPGGDGEVVFGRNVMVAWDAGREAARAVYDALPILERADHVDLVTVNPVAGAHRHGDEPGADIALDLAHHDIDVEVQQLVAHDMEPGDTILSRLGDRGSDMLVMGAYGHSRMRELVLGGVTRSVLEQMPVPVLLSH